MQLRRFPEFRSGCPETFETILHVAKSRPIPVIRAKPLSALDDIVTLAERIHLTSRYNNPASRAS